MRPLSPATELRRLKRLCNEYMRDLATAKAELLRWRTRAEQAEQETKEWKGRFDLLLRREEPKP